MKQNLKTGNKEPEAWKHRGRNTGDDTQEDEQNDELGLKMDDPMRKRGEHTLYIHTGKWHTEGDTAEPN